MADVDDPMSLKEFFENNGADYVEAALNLRQAVQGVRRAVTEEILQKLNNDGVIDITPTYDNYNQARYRYTKSKES